MAENGWVVTLKQIVDQMAETGVFELEVRSGDLRIRLKRGEREDGFAAAKAVPSSGDDHAEGRLLEEQQFHRVVAPLTGVFYVSPNPSAESYVEAGDWVEESTVVGLIETMKVFNEVVAECRGRVASLPVQQGQLVQAGDTIVLVDTAALPDETGEAVS